MMIGGLWARCSVAVALALAVGGCGNAGSRPEGSAANANALLSSQASDLSAARHVAIAHSGSALSVARSLAATLPAVAEMLAPARHGFEAASDGPRFARATGAESAHSLSAQLAASGRGALRVALGSLDGPRVELRPTQSNDVAAATEDGVVTYAGVAAATDLLVMAADTRIEELLLLRGPEAPKQFRWNVEVGAGLELGRATDGAQVFQDAAGNPLLRIAPAFLVDAMGERRAVSMSINDGVLTLSIDDTGLSYPLLVDPVLEVFSWQQKTPPANAGAITYHSLAFDSTRKKVVLYGGTADLNTALSGTFEYDGTTWTPVSASQPGGLFHFSMAYDTTLQTVIFGGTNGSTASDKTWAYGGASWVQKCTTAPCSTAGNHPAARSGAAMAADTTNHKMLLFGGSINGIPQQDLWQWDGTNWTPLCTTSGCIAAGPTARQLAQMAFNPNSGNYLLFGGTTGVLQNDLWEWNGTSWTADCTTACTPPGARSDFGMTYDTSRKRLVVFGGANSGGLDWGDTEEWDGTAWTQRANGTPTARRSTPLAFDSNRRRVVAYGGLFNGTTGLTTNETWEYSTSGGACTANTDCDTGFCVDGVCCQTACTGSCMACNQNPTPGVCSPVVSAVDPDTCTGASYCNAGGTCVTKLTPGTACSNTVQCASGVCSSVDGVCCNSDCTGLCQSCVAAKTGAAAGVCSAVTVGTDPDAECTDQGAASCGTDGVCGGVGICQKYVAATVCLAQSCSNATLMQTNASTCNGTGTCVGGSAVACNTGYVCNGVSCATSCAGSDALCVSGYYCAGTVCTQKKPSGSCTATDQCATGNCVDGVCCDAPCTGLCQACTALKKGSGADGACGSIADGTDPDNECANPPATGCTPGGFCNGAGACQANVKDGFACGTTSCSIGSQSGKACQGGTCTTVNQVACDPYICGATACLTTCGADTDCTNGNYCNAGHQCKPKQSGGATCTGASQCGNGLCVDGVCCDRACDGLCEACTAIKKGTGADGTCGPVATGTDPDNECTDDGAMTCMHNGMCDTGNQCQLYAHGVSCGATVCSGNSVTGQICSGTGSCSVDTTGTDCSPFTCQTNGCKNPCAVDTDCVAGDYCSPTGSCVTQKPIGGTCTNANECAKNYCADGYCCDSDCKGQCQACDNPSSQGICSPSVGAPHTGRAACDGATGVCAGSCDGTNGAACTYAGSTTSCGTSCDNNQETDSVCNSQGACIVQPAQLCAGNLVCDASTQQCKTSCTVDADCATGYSCDATQACSPITTNSPTCDGDHTVKTPGQPDQDCTPYGCSGTSCKQSCTSVDDCVTPAVCNETQQCVPPSGSTSSASKDSGGCSCRTAGGGSGGESKGPVEAVLALLLAGIWFRRRRAA